MHSRQTVPVYLYVKSNYLVEDHMDHLLPMLLYFACILRLSLTRLLAGLCNKYMDLLLPLQLLQSLTSSMESPAAVMWFWSRV